MGSKKFGVMLATATIGCTAAGLLGAGTAAADDYVGGTPTQQGPAVEAVSAVNTTTTGGSALAVTGADIAELAAVGAGMIATGAVLARRRRAPQRD